MADLLALEVVTPERLLVREEVATVQAPAKTGFLYYEGGGGRHYMAVHGGFLEVLQDRVRVLADAAERAEDIDVQRAKAAMKRAEEQVFHPAPDVDPAIALGAMARAQARIDAAAQKQPA
jgi:F-type H+-transporting ATPase subunit epsilon